MLYIICHIVRLSGSHVKKKYKLYYIRLYLALHFTGEKRTHLSNENVDISFRVQDTFLEQPSSGTLKFKMEKFKSTLVVIYTTTS